MTVVNSRAQPNRAVTRLLSFFAVVAAALWLLAVFSTHRILFPPGPGFVDILVYKGRFTLYHTAKFFTSRAYSGFAYPAGAAPIYEAFYKTSDALQTYFLLAGFTTLAALIAAFAYLHRARASNLFLPLLIATCFPLVFLIQRANIEIVLWIIVALGIVAYRRGSYTLAAVLFGLASATKLYPIFMLGLFLGPSTGRRPPELRAFAIGILTAIAAMMLSIAYAGPSFSVAAKGFFSGVSGFQTEYVNKVSRVEIAFDHCLFSPVKFWAYSHHTSPAPYAKLYFLIAGSFAVLLFLRVRTLPFLNRVVFLVAAMVALPPVSFTYTLVHLYVPLLFLLCALVTQQLRPSWTALAALTVLLFLMMPLVSIGVVYQSPTGLVQSIALVALLILTSLIAWPTSLRSEIA